MWLFYWFFFKLCGHFIASFSFGILLLHAIILSNPYLIIPWYAIFAHLNCNVLFCSLLLMFVPFLLNACSLKVYGDSLKSMFDVFSPRATFVFSCQVPRLSPAWEPLKANFLHKVFWGGVYNFILQNTCSVLFAFMNNILLKQSHSYVLSLAAFPTTMAKSSDSNRGHIVQIF